MCQLFNTFLCFKYTSQLCPFTVLIIYNVKTNANERNIINSEVCVQTFDW